MASSNINEKVQQALEEGHGWEEIKAHLSTLDNPEAKSYLEGLKATSSPTQEEPQRTNLTKGLDWAQENPKEALVYGAGLYGATQLPKVVSKIADYRLEKRKVDLKERSLAAYEAQVAKQGLSAADSLNPHDELINNVRQNEFEQQKATTPSVQDQIAQERLRQAQLKTQRAELEQQNWVAKNTLSEAEQAFGRKAKDPTELRLMQAAVQQQAGKAPVAPTPAGPSPLAELPVITAPAAPAAPVTPAQAAPAPVVPTAAPVETAPAITQPANVVSTGPTPEAAAAPIKEAKVAKEAVTPTPEKQKAKTEPKIPKPEFFKNASPAERYMYGTFTKYMDQPVSAQAVVARAADYLPEGTKFEMQPGGEGGGLHPEQKQHFNRFVSERMGVDLKEGKLPEDFRWTTENRNKLAESVQTELQQHAKAGTLGKLGKGALAAATLLGISEAVKAAQKGDYGPLREAGFNIGGPIAASAIGLTALSKAAGVPFGLATYAGGLNEGEQKELAYRQKVGAGRGIAPPSAYMR